MRTERPHDDKARRKTSEKGKRTEERKLVIVLYREVLFLFCVFVFNSLIAQKITKQYNFLKINVAFCFLACYNSFRKLGNVP